MSQLENKPKATFRQKLLTQIAQKHLRIEALETRKSDSAND